MATDIRGLPITTIGYEATPVAPAPAGFTIGVKYPLLCIGVDCIPAPPVLYVLLKPAHASQPQSEA